MPMITTLNKTKKGQDKMSKIYQARSITGANIPTSAS